ncbi:hypothetical protein [Pseudomonas japonica]|nr:hypothetical protein [Pseudomonas japonica]
MICVIPENRLHRGMCSGTFAAGWNVMFKIRSDAFSGNKLLHSSLIFILCFLLCLGFYIYALANKPAPSDGVLSRTEGKFLVIASSSQRGTTFIVEESGSGELVKLSAISGYTKIRSGFSEGVGRNIVVRHYGPSVVACWIDRVEYCAAMCTTKYECELTLYQASLSTLKKTLYTMLALAVICLVAYLIKKRER